MKCAIRKEEHSEMYIHISVLTVFGIQICSLNFIFGKWYISCREVLRMCSVGLRWSIFGAVLVCYQGYQYVSCKQPCLNNPELFQNILFGAFALQMCSEGKTSLEWWCDSRTSRINKHQYGQGLSGLGALFGIFVPSGSPYSQLLSSWPIPRTELWARRTQDLFMKYHFRIYEWTVFDMKMKYLQL